MAETLKLVEAPTAAPTQTPARRAKLVRGVLLLGALGLAGWIGHGWWYGLSHVTTDNAQVKGHIVPVLAKVGGFVTAVAVSDNQRVEAGELIVTLDDRDYAARLKQADGKLAALRATVGGNGQVGQAMAQVSAAQAQAASAQAAVAAAEANATRAQRELTRIRDMATQHYASQQQLDAAEAAERAALAELDRVRQSALAAQAQVRAATAALRGADGELLAAEAAREQAAIALADTKLLAPAGGVVSKKNVEVGQLVAPGQPLLAVVPTDDLWVVANLKETEIADVNPGDTVEVRIDAYPGRTWKGEVDSLGAATGSEFSLLPADNATGNFTKVVQRIPVKIRLTAGEHPEAPLRPGMSAVVDIATK